MRAEDAYRAFVDAGIAFWTGVPDSLLAEFCAFVATRSGDRDHVVAANEGGAIAIAAGHHLATGRVPGVYLQNSGLGNTVNPLISLADPEVYRIPLVLLIGWRGRPGSRDEPQHRRMGEITLPMLETMGIPAQVVVDDGEAFAASTRWAVEEALVREGPTALVVPEGTFQGDGALAGTAVGSAAPSREEAVIAVAGSLSPDVAIVATTGKTSRELYEHRKRSGDGTERDFLTVGSMGHASQIALGIALAQPERKVCVFDGDGAAIMHLGSLAVIGEHAPTNLMHILFNNHAHESVGGQPTPSTRLSFTELARAAGYLAASSIEDLGAVPDAVATLQDEPGPALLEILVAVGARPDLGRPAETPAENRSRFVTWLRR